MPERSEPGVASVRLRPPVVTSSRSYGTVSPPPSSTTRRAGSTRVARAPSRTVTRSLS